VDFEPGRRIVSQSDMGNMKPTVTHEFEEVDAGTRLTRRIQIETSGALTLMNPMMRVMVRRSNAQFIENLKRLLET
jgi:carbon monoxide dehydrogenase subunit G